MADTNRTVLIYETAIAQSPFSVYSVLWYILQHALEPICICSGHDSVTLFSTLTAAMFVCRVVFHPQL